MNELLRPCRNVFVTFRKICLDRRVFNLFLAIAIGTLSGLGAVLFHHILQGAQYAFYQESGDILGFYGGLARWKLFLLPALGGLIVGIIVRYGASEAKGHGVPEVMSALTLKGGRIRKRVALVKIIASAVCIGSGGSSGREGPMVQIGSSVGSTLGQLFRVPVMEQRTMVGCGAAAGIAATFNAPIAGTLFALEILVGDFGLSSFSPVVLSSVTATAISRAYWGDLPTFNLPLYEIHSFWEYGIYPFLGILAGLAAVLFISVLYASEDFFERLALPDWTKPGLGGLLLGSVLFFFPHVFGVGYGSMNLALHGRLPGLMLLALVFAKVIATSCTLGSGGSGGIFAPSLFIGAMTGGFFGWLAMLLFPGYVAPSGAYALVGMGAVVAGTTQAPITAILILFEMTGDYKIILPMMITCIIATLTASAIKSGSIYTLKLKKRGIDISGGLEQNILRTLRVGSFMYKGPATIPEDMLLIDIIQTFRSDDASYLHVLDDKGLLAGIISFRDIRPYMNEECFGKGTTAGKICTKAPVTVTPQDSIQSALAIMGQHGISQLPVVESGGTRRLLGTLPQRDVLAAYDKAVLKREIQES
ncbi:chloride channel protein [Desulfobaculum bizertense]|uniref:Chloride channel protein, CIC family n=1 Tax=Desulfobaculum bizertense DSM 18034 TaxID=1121442 RepID=A0A1T4VXL0_9BACT|nr:chloride channel protein [Desulfobaculum bizertense]SKA69723.1 chloride channel protein, CIC family [Desulfobaculum bizertense DSM 18034]